MVTKEWDFKEDCTYTTRGRKYNVHAAVRFSEDLEVFDLQLKGVNLCYSSPCDGSYRSFVRHVKQTLDADLSHPVILNEEGEIIDGKHRLAKALLEGEGSIKAVQFAKDPNEIWSYDNSDEEL